MMFIVRIFPEITIKSVPVRKKWSKRLADNIRTLAKRIDETVTVKLDWDRIIVRTKGGDDSLAELKAILSCTPGIANFSLVESHSFESMEDIYQHTLRHWQGRLKNTSFRVSAKRRGKHDFNSAELERYIGAGLNESEASARVQLKNPDQTVMVEVNDNECAIVHERSMGIGGFPIGTQEEVLSLVSGGFDSAVASFQMMRRGLKTHFCFFNIGGRAHEVAVKEVAFFLWKKFGASHRVKFFSVPFDDIINDISANVSQSNMGVVLKRMMLRCAERIAERAELSALVTGEAIAQVSSQTLHNLKIIDEVSDHLVLRPLIATAKGEIIDTARVLGAEELLSSIPEYCGMIAQKPSAHVKLSSVLEEEAKMDMSLLDECISATRVQAIDEIMDVTADSEMAYECVASPGLNDVIVDIRHPNEIDLKPLESLVSADFVHGDVMSVPFFRLNSEAQRWSDDRRYLLYCDRGVMSQLHAQHLVDQGVRNVAVWRPDQKN